ncbi:glycosyltransferase [Arthrobacter sp. OV608]|uniref:glycosyltransferase n=1 Tax=Arthrobacter sp. OV608 TaxID=1882768 RepID=UPI0008B0D593|nr:glycosyltransferase [Arthrobacter sp. OV608]SEQ51359.1 Putative rhamnosyl transferase [Arthrobacter sp. OV608]
MHGNFDHILLTRFNLPSPGAESFVRGREGWLHSRVELFEQYCLPSVENQTVKTFHWIIYFDPQSPAWLKDKVGQLSQTHVFNPIYRAQVSRDDLLNDLKLVSGARHRNVITTNLDNDDALSANFVERLQSVPVESDRAAVYLVRGLIRSGDRLYSRTDRSNAFCSVQEDWNSAQTCWSTWHNLLGKTMKVIQVGGEPAWLQVIHGSNVSNRVRGRRTSPMSHRPNFGALLDGVGDVAAGDLLKDLLIQAPQRSIRDLGRSVARRATLAVLGRDGLDRLKAEWASHSLRRNQVPDEVATELQRKLSRTSGGGGVDDVPA